MAAWRPAGSLTIRYAGASLNDHIAAFTSTGSKRPESLFGTRQEDLPSRMVRSSGCRVWDENGRAYTDYIMGLGAVALGYGDAEYVPWQIGATMQVRWSVRRLCSCE